MADESSTLPAISVNIKGPSELKLSVSISPSSTVQEFKQAIASQCPKEHGIDPAALRLVYSGKILKDDDVLSKYSLKEGNTVHMVRDLALVLVSPCPFARRTSADVSINRTPRSALSPRTSCRSKEHLALLQLVPLAPPQQAAQQLAQLLQPPRQRLRPPVSLPTSQLGALLGSETNAWHWCSLLSIAYTASRSRATLSHHCSTRRTRMPSVRPPYLEPAKSMC